MYNKPIITNKGFSAITHYLNNASALPVQRMLLSSNDYSSEDLANFEIADFNIKLATSVVATKDKVKVVEEGEEVERYAIKNYGSFTNESVTAEFDIKSIALTCFDESNQEIILAILTCSAPFPKVPASTTSYTFSFLMDLVFNGSDNIQIITTAAGLVTEQYLRDHFNGIIKTNLLPSPSQVTMGNIYFLTQTAGGYEGNKYYITAYNGSTYSWVAFGEGGQGGGIVPDDMHDYKACPKTNGFKIKFTTPTDTTITDATTGETKVICKIAGVKIVAKAGTNDIIDWKDGTLLKDCTIRDEYKDDWFEYSELNNNTNYVIGFFPYSTQGVYNYSAQLKRKTGTQMVLGFDIDEDDADPATRVSYPKDVDNFGFKKFSKDASGIGDCGDFNETWFVKENRPVALTYARNVDYELDHNDHSKRLNGTISDYQNDNYGGNMMSEFPLTYVKRWTTTEDGKTITHTRFANYKVDNDYKFDAFCDTEDQETPNNKMYFSMYEGSFISNKMRSLANKSIAVSRTYAQLRLDCEANGEYWTPWTYSKWLLIIEFLYMMGKSTNLQLVYGNGNCNTGAKVNTGATYNKGQFYGTTATNASIKVFYIENLWANVWTQLAGINGGTNGKCHVKMRPPYNNTSDGYTDCDIANGTDSFIKNESCNEFGRFPITLGASETTYYSDCFWYSRGENYACIVGGSWGDGGACGACLDLHHPFSHVGDSVGSALCC